MSNSSLSKEDQILIKLVELKKEQEHIVTDVAENKKQYTAISENIVTMTASIASIDKRQAVGEVKAGLFGSLGGFASGLWLQFKTIMGG